ncbi:MAG: thiamine phosphate synthase [Pseudolabrys sp.]|nr:thiamine phosphate synthase [Pseudolabrys sp.]
MSSRPKQPQPRPAPRLYLVTPPIVDAAAFAPQLTAALGASDIAAVLVRLADADERTLINRVKLLAPVAQDRGAAVLLDGHQELVARSGADGAHLRGLDAFSAALEQLKPDRIAGAGQIETRHDAMIAAESGADYLMFGSPDEAPDVTRERVAWSAEVFELPCVAFASSAEAIAPLVAAGADFIALDYVWTASDVAASVAEAVSRAKLPEPAA